MRWSEFLSELSSKALRWALAGLAAAIVTALVPGNTMLREFFRSFFKDVVQETMKDTLPQQPPPTETKGSGPGVPAMPPSDGTQAARQQNPPPPNGLPVMPTPPSSMLPTPPVVAQDDNIIEVSKYNEYALKSGIKYNVVLPLDKTVYFKPIGGGLRFYIDHNLKFGGCVNRVFRAHTVGTSEFKVATCAPEGSRMRVVRVEAGDLIPD